MPTKIEWCDETINPQGWGCYGPGGTPESPKICPGCYALRIAERARKSKRNICPDCLAFKPHWHPERCLKAYGRKPKAIFWQDMGDLWHDFSPPDQIDAVLNVAIAAPQHTHIFLTKNPARYLAFVHQMRMIKNCYCGVTVRNQEEADRLIPTILELARVGIKVFVSYEPAWGEVNLRRIQLPQGITDSLGGWYCEGGPKLCLVICGGQTGPGARPMHPDWVRSVRDQCELAGVDFFFKGWGKYCQASSIGDDTNYPIVVGAIDGVEHNALPWPLARSRRPK